MSEEKEYDILQIAGGEYKTRLIKTYREREPWHKVSPHEVESFMPGQILEIYVKVGDQVKKGSELILFKAMKMNNHIKSAINGRIKSINVEVGENVPKGKLMIEIE